MIEYLLIRDKKYEIIKKDTTSPYRTIYTLKDNNISYRLLIEDYREASFMYDKFYSAAINCIGDGKLQTVNVEDIKLINKKNE